MIKNLVFDFGGVIADLNRQGAVDAFIAIGLKDADTRLDKYHQTGIFQELEEGRISDSEFIRIMEELCQRSLTWPEVQQAWLGFLSGVDLKKLHLLEELRQEGYHLYLLSNTNPFVMGWACSKDFTSEGKSLAEYFDRLYLSYKVGCTKPDKKNIHSHAGRCENSSGRNTFCRRRSSKYSSRTRIRNAYILPQECHGLA